jgi:glycosyltransferase involved in cell wall biosynthesis
MKIVLLSNSHLNCNTGFHIISIVNALGDLGVECTVAVPPGSNSNGAEKGLQAKVIDTDQLVNSIQLERPDLIHLWTPREENRRVLGRIRETYICPYCVHFEDNEYHLTRISYGLSENEFKRWISTALNAEVPGHLTNPAKLASLLENSAGMTALVDELLEFKPGNIPGVVIWPGFDEDLSWGMKCDRAYRRELGIGDDEFVVTYTGNMHPANCAEIRSLYLAVALVNRCGTRLRLVRTGEDYAALADTGEELLRANALELGMQPRSELPRLLSIADVLVQPGQADAFNTYRFPSKLPEFLASERPVVLPKCNIGKHLTDGYNSVLLNEGNALEIARVLERLLPDEAAMRLIGEQGRLFAIKHLRWAISARTLLTFYESIISGKSADAE